MLRIFITLCTNSVTFLKLSTECKWYNRNRSYQYFSWFFFNKGRTKKQTTITVVFACQVLNCAAALYHCYSEPVKDLHKCKCQLLTIPSELFLLTPDPVCTSHFAHSLAIIHRQKLTRWKFIKGQVTFFLQFYLLSKQNCHTKLKCQKKN